MSQLDANAIFTTLGELITYLEIIRIELKEIYLTKEGKIEHGINICEVVTDKTNDFCMAIFKYEIARAKGE